MNEKNIIREAMKVRGYNQKILADLVGMKGQSGVSERLRGASMRVDTFVKFLNTMGFDVVIKDRNKDNKGNSWVLTEARETEKDE